MNVDFQIVEFLGAVDSYCSVLEPIFDDGCNEFQNLEFVEAVVFYNLQAGVSLKYHKFLSALQVRVLDAVVFQDLELMVLGLVLDLRQEALSPAEARFCENSIVLEHKAGEGWSVLGPGGAEC